MLANELGFSLHIFSKLVSVPVLITAIPVILLIHSDILNWQLQNVSAETTSVTSLKNTISDKHTTCLAFKTQQASTEGAKTVY